MAAAANIWLATVRPDHTPHLVPIWFVELDGRIYICTSRRSVKARNFLTNPAVSLALEDGTDPLVVEGTAHPLDELPPAVVRAFQQKYDWTITDATYDLLVEIAPTRIR